MIFQQDRVPSKSTDQGPAAVGERDGRLHRPAGEGRRNRSSFNLRYCPPHHAHRPAAEFKGTSGVDEYAIGSTRRLGVGPVLDPLDRRHLPRIPWSSPPATTAPPTRVYEPLRGSRAASTKEGTRNRSSPAARPDQAGLNVRDTVCLNDLLATCADPSAPTAGRVPPKTASAYCQTSSARPNGPVREATIHQSPRGDLAIRQGPGNCSS